MKVLKVGRIRVRVPDEVEVLEVCDLDELYGHSSMKTRADALIVLRGGDRVIAAIVEDTGRPEPRDFERLNNTLRDLIEKRLVRPSMVVLKVLHHKGFKTGRALLLSLARAFRVELQECRSKATDLCLILWKRRLLS